MTTELRTLLRNSISYHYERVKKVMMHFGQATPEVVTIPDDDTRILRARLMSEEVLETIEKGLGISIFVRNPVTGGVVSVDFSKLEFEIERPVDMVELVDGCYDTTVVTTGTLISVGVPDMPGQELVDDANLAKFGGGKDEYGKFQKPPGWKPADIAGFLQQLEDEAKLFPPNATTATLHDPHEEERE